MRLHPLLIGAVFALAACTHDNSPPASSSPQKSTAQLLNTYWKLTQLDGQVVTVQGDRDVHMVLHSENQRIAGFSGCNQMMGSYVLNGDQIKFDQMAGTMMACIANEELERKFLAMFPQVARWHIEGETLQLQDAGGKTLAMFESVYLR